MSLTDGRAKMSKSAELDNSRINLNDDPATIARKIKKCKSDEAARGLSGTTLSDRRRRTC